MNIKLTDRFRKALDLAAHLHQDQTRKGTGIPYVTHLLIVAGYVIENGGDENEAIAALLHDAVEDQGGAKTAALIRETFGEQVAEIVSACTDTDEEPKPPWKVRKTAFIHRLQTASPSARRVCAADKLHNARSILNDYRVCGEQLWNRFTGGKEGTLWYYRALANVLTQTNTGPLAYDLNRVVAELEYLVNARSTG